MDTPQTKPDRSGHIRTKWAAIGAAIAVSIGAGGIGIVNATVSSGAMPVYIAISPCRLADTRPDSNVGTKNTPLGAAETWTLDGWGDVAGDCNLPQNTAALQLNVTAVGATLPTFLAVFPAGGSVPSSSNLNPVPGAPPTPNSVTATLSNTGQFSVYNLQGNVNVLIDVVGYFEDHVHASTDITNEAGVAFAYTELDPLSLGTSPQVVASVPIRVPSDGHVSVTANINWLNADAAPGFDIAECQLTKGTTIDPAQPTFNLNDMDAGVTLALLSETSSHVLPVALADNPPLFINGQTIKLVCDELVGDVQIYSVDMQAEFFPTNYTPQPLIIVPLGEEDPGATVPPEG